VQQTRKHTHTDTHGMGLGWGDERKREMVCRFQLMRAFKTQKRNYKTEVHDKRMLHVEFVALSLTICSLGTLMILYLQRTK